VSSSCQQRAEHGEGPLDAGKGLSPSARPPDRRSSWRSQIRWSRTARPQPSAVRLVPPEWEGARRRLRGDDSETAGGDAQPSRTRGPSSVAVQGPARPKCRTVWRAMDAHKLTAGRAEAWDWRWRSSEPVVHARSRRDFRLPFAPRRAIACIREKPLCLSGWKQRDRAPVDGAGPVLFLSRSRSVRDRALIPSRVPRRGFDARR
jgi:hypothetical protein